MGDLSLFYPHQKTCYLRPDINCPCTFRRQVNKTWKTGHTSLQGIVHPLGHFLIFTRLSHGFWGDMEESKKRGPWLCVFFLCVFKIWLLPPNIEVSQFPITQFCDCCRIQRRSGKKGIDRIDKHHYDYIFDLGKITWEDLHTAPVDSWVPLR